MCIDMSEKDSFVRNVLQGLAQDIQAAGGMITVEDLRSAQPSVKAALEAQASQILVLTIHLSNVILNAMRSGKVDERAFKHSAWVRTWLFMHDNFFVLKRLLRCYDL